MNYGISILFRVIPLAMVLFCVGYGAFVLYESENDARWVAGPVLLSLGMICVALFSTAATIIRQLIHTYNRTARYALPILGYAAAIFTFAAGWGYMADAATVEHFVAEHVVCGVSFIVVCISLRPLHVLRSFLSMRRRLAMCRRRGALPANNLLCLSVLVC